MATSSKTKKSSSKHQAERIVNILKEEDKPIRATVLAKALHLPTTRHVNPILTKLQQDGRVTQVVISNTPMWKYGGYPQPQYPPRIDVQSSEETSPEEQPRSYQMIGTTQIAHHQDQPILGPSIVTNGPTMGDVTGNSYSVQSVQPMQMLNANTNTVMQPYQYDVTISSVNDATGNISQELISQTIRDHGANGSVAGSITPSLDTGSLSGSVASSMMVNVGSGNNVFDLNMAVNAVNTPTYCVPLSTSGLDISNTTAFHIPTINSLSNPASMSNPTFMFGSHTTGPYISTEHIHTTSFSSDASRNKHSHTHCHNQPQPHTHTHHTHIHHTPRQAVRPHSFGHVYTPHHHLSDNQSLQNDIMQLFKDKYRDMYVKTSEISQRVKADSWGDVEACLGALEKKGLIERVGAHSADSLWRSIESAWLDGVDKNSNNHPHNKMYGDNNVTNTFQQPGYRSYTMLATPPLVPPSFGGTPVLGRQSWVPIRGGRFGRGRQDGSTGQNKGHDMPGNSHFNVGALNTGMNAMNINQRGRGRGRGYQKFNNYRGNQNNRGGKRPVLSNGTTEGTGPTTSNVTTSTPSNQSLVSKASSVTSTGSVPAGTNPGAGDQTEKTTDGPMTENHKHLLEIHRQDLVSGLVLDEGFMNALHRNKVLSEDCCKQIKAQKTRAQRIEIFLKLLPQQPDAAFSSLRQVLYECNQPWLAEQLLFDASASRG